MFTSPAAARARRSGNADAAVRPAADNKSERRVTAGIAILQTGRAKVCPRIEGRRSRCNCDLFASPHETVSRLFRACGALHSMVSASGLHPSATGTDDSRLTRLGAE